MSTDQAVPELRVLVIDDNADAATSLAYLLQLLGCKTAVAFGGATAISIAKLFKPVLVFIDYDMPGPNGCEVLQQLKQLEAPVSNALYVCLTGRDTPDDEEQCLGAGFDRFVRKPLDPLVLHELLDLTRVRAASAATYEPTDGKSGSVEM